MGSINLTYIVAAAQKMKFSIKDFFGKCEQIRRKLIDIIEIVLK